MANNNNNTFIASQRFRYPTFARIEAYEIHERMFFYIKKKYFSFRLPLLKPVYCLGILEKEEKTGNIELL